MSELPAASGSASKAASEGAIPVPLERPEQRAHSRFKVEGATAVLGKGGLFWALGLSRFRGAVVNLSQGGILIQAGKIVPAGTRLRVRIVIPKPPDVIESAGEVRWCAQGARNDAHFYVGIRFEGLAPGMKKKIEQMREWFTSAEYRAKTFVRKDASSTTLKPPRPS